MTLITPIAFFEIFLGKFHCVAPQTGFYTVKNSRVTFKKHLVSPKISLCLSTYAVLHYELLKESLKKTLSFSENFAVPLPVRGFALQNSQGVTLKDV